jgi:hypothetical protein
VVWHDFHCNDVHLQCFGSLLNVICHFIFQASKENFLSILGTPHNMVLQGIYISATMRNRKFR